jgi:hypothetical protein
VREPVDVILLVHNRLDHLEATVDALEQRTRHPYRLTIVDNASQPDVRNWLHANRHRFERVIFRPTNEHVPAFRHGIHASTSDPFVVSDPDVVVPDLQPCWLERMLALVDRHPDFGLIGMGLDQSNRPPVLDPHVIDPATVVDDEIVETGIGTTFQVIRRRALLTEYRSDGQVCTDVRRNGFRVGWTLNVLGVHLGWDDFIHHPGHLLSKGTDYGIYNEVDLVKRPPTLSELATAAPVVAQTRRLDVPDAAVLEITFGDHAIGASLPESFSIDDPGDAALPFTDGAAGAVVLIDPPAERAAGLVADACRVAARAVIVVAALEAFGGAPAAALAPAGWSGREAPGPGDVTSILARLGEEEPSLNGRLTASLVGDRERWLDVFAAAAFGAGERRLWIFESDEPGRTPARVAYDSERVHPWAGEALQRAVAPHTGPLGRLWRRADLADRLDLWRARLRAGLRDRAARR